MLNIIYINIVQDIKEVMGIILMGSYLKVVKNSFFSEA